MNNALEVSYTIDDASLDRFAERLHLVHQRKPIPQVKMLAVMFSARVADKRSRRDEAVELYKEAKAIARSVGDEERAIECSKRKAICKACGQEEIDEVIEKYNARIDALRQRKFAENPELAACHTVGVQPPSMLRIMMSGGGDVLADEITARLSDINQSCTVRRCRLTSS